MAPNFLLVPETEFLRPGFHTAGFLEVWFPWHPASLCDCVSLDVLVVIEAWFLNNLVSMVLGFSEAWCP